MKKFIKVMLILAAVFFAAGLCFSVGGAAMGATLKSVQVADQIREWYHGFLDDDWEETEDRISTEKDLETPSSQRGKEVYEYDSMYEAEVELKYDAFYVEYHDQENICVEVENDPDNSVQVTMEGKKLKIQSKTRKRKDRKVTLYLPKDSILEKFSAEIGAGMVEFTEDFSAEDVEIQVGAGQVSNRGTLKAGTFEVEVGVGSAEIFGLDARDIKGECGTGELYLEMSGRETDYGYQLKCGLGSITIGENEYFSLNRTRTLENPGAEGRMELECGLGGIVVDFLEG